MLFMSFLFMLVHYNRVISIYIQCPQKNLPRSIYPISSIAHPNQTLRRIARREMKYTTNNSTRSVNIKTTLQTGSPDHREID